MERGKELGHLFDRDFQEIQSFADNLGLELGCRVQMTNQFMILWASHQEFDGGQIVGIQRVCILGFRHGNETHSPAGRKGLQDRITENVRMESVDAVVSPILSQGLIKHDRREFVEGLGADIGVVSGGEGATSLTQLGK
ncbi:MAG: hypothetical protein CFE44_10320 [Burkholderiales bacterium PBB4]|nr:MAG: hypothetical protein CFE44_10320 [Burkholderiales bacterium PBB4]